jgi:hypothetical protein
MTLLERTQREIDADIVRIQNYIDELNTAMEYLPTPEDKDPVEKQLYFAQRKKDDYLRELPDTETL